MRDVVAAVGPVGINFYIEETFENYESGLYDPPNGDQCCVEPMRLGYHAPIVTGYGTDPKHGDYWILENFWGAFFYFLVVSCKIYG